MVDESRGVGSEPGKPESQSKGPTMGAASPAEWTRLLQRIYWPRIFAEGLAIVASILLAFAVNAWWEDSRSEQERQAILRGLREDFEASLAEMDRARSRGERVRTGASTLLALMGPTPDIAASTDSDRHLIDLLQGGLFYRPISGTLGGLLASEELSVVTSVELRRQLARWTQILDEIQVSQSALGDFYADDFMPYLYRRIPIRTLDAMAAPTGAGPASRFPVDMTALLTDLEFENLVNEVFFRTNVGFATLDRANTVGEEIMRVIDSELGR